MPVVKNRVRGEVLRHLAETGLEAGLPAGPADARFCVADHTRRRIDHVRLHQRSDRQVRRGWVAARVRYEPAVPHPLTAEFRQTVDSLRQQLRLLVNFLVPVLVVCRPCAAGRRHSDRSPWLPPPESSAPDPSKHRPGSPETRPRVRRWQWRPQYRNSLRPLVAARQSAILGVGPMLQQHWLNIGGVFR